VIESLDGRIHLAQRGVIAAHKPLFYRSRWPPLEDAREIARLARDAGVQWFSSSSLRLATGAAMKIPDATGALTVGPGPLESHHYSELAWYAVHPIELLYTIMGQGCETVTGPAARMSM
jgi:hypothetical protein